MFHTTALVKTKADDVEEAHGDADTGLAPTDCMDGFLYQGSSDLELGQDVEARRQRTHGSRSH